MKRQVCEQSCHVVGRSTGTYRPPVVQTCEWEMGVAVDPCPLVQLCILFPSVWAEPDNMLEHFYVLPRLCHIRWQKDFEGVIEITKSADFDFIEREIIWVGLASSHESFQSGCRNKCEGPLEGATWPGTVGGF